jgi:uncharacterized protein
MRMDVLVKSGKDKNQVIKLDFAKYEVWVKARPVKGEANKAVLEVLASYFSVKTYNLRIVRGLTSPLKIIELTK